MKRILSQLRDNSVALTSILIALTSLAYNAWRYERTEHNQNVRAAAFELLLKLADFERVVFLSHYDRDATNGNPRTGWTYVIVINDFASVLPEPVGVRAGRLRDTWREQWEGLMQDDDTAVDRIEVDIAALREGTLDTLRSLR
jgi:hypothetical protein